MGKERKGGERARDRVRGRDGWGGHDNISDCEETQYHHQSHQSDQLVLLLLFISVERVNQTDV